MTDLDDILIPAVQELMDELGKDVTWTREVGATYNPATGTVSGGTPTPATVKVTPPEEYERRFVDGDVVKDGDAIIGIETDITFTPKAGDNVTIDGEVWECINVGRVYSGASVCLWYPVQIRR